MFVILQFTDFVTRRGCPSQEIWTRSTSTGFINLNQYFSLMFIKVKWLKKQTNSIFVNNIFFILQFVKFVWGKEVCLRRPGLGPTSVGFSNRFFSFSGTCVDDRRAYRSRTDFFHSLCSASSPYNWNKNITTALRVCSNRGGGGGDSGYCDMVTLDGPFIPICDCFVIFVG